MLDRSLEAVTDVLATTPHVMFCVKSATASTSPPTRRSPTVPVSPALVTWSVERPVTSSPRTRRALRGPGPGRDRDRPHVDQRTRTDHPTGPFGRLVPHLEVAVDRRRRRPGRRRQRVGRPAHTRRCRSAARPARGRRRRGARALRRADRGGRSRCRCRDVRRSARTDGATGARAEPEAARDAVPTRGGTAPARPRPSCRSPTSRIGAGTTTRVRSVATSGRWSVRRRPPIALRIVRSARPQASHRRSVAARSPTRRRRCPIAIGIDRYVNHTWTWLWFLSSSYQTSGIDAGLATINRSTQRSAGRRPPPAPAPRDARRSISEGHDDARRAVVATTPRR